MVEAIFFRAKIIFVISSVLFLRLFTTTYCNLLYKNTANVIENTANVIVIVLQSGFLSSAENLDF